MFGYLDIEKDKLEEGKRGLWQTFMCGMCFSTKRQFGNVPRLFISNDVNFFNVLFHSIRGKDINLEYRRCFSHPFKKRTVAEQTELADKMAAANVLLTYWNLYDDVVDGGNVKKKTAFRALKKPYIEAKNILPEMDVMLSERYAELRRMEMQNNANIDMVSHCFAQLTMQFAEQILETDADERVKNLCYNLGKWIYLIDALDDVEKDADKGNYNPFAACYGTSDRKQLSLKFDELQFVMFAVLNRVAMSYNDLNLDLYTCILKNVLFESIRDKTNQVLERYKPSCDVKRSSVDRA